MCAVPNMAVFWGSLTSCFPGMLLMYFLNDFEIVPLAPIITGIPFGFTLHMLCSSIVRSLYIRIISASFLITFMSPEIPAYINMHVPFSLYNAVCNTYRTISLLLFLLLSKPFFVLPLYVPLYFGLGGSDCEWVVRSELPRCSNLSQP